MVGCSGDKAYLWSYGEHRILKDTYTGHQGLIFTSKFISGTKLATGSADRTIKIWDLYGRQCIYFDYYIYKNNINTYFKVHKLYLLVQNVMI